MTQSTYDPANCPPKIELSAWHDGEGEPRITEHVDRCEACRDVDQFYGDVDDTVRTQIRPDSELVARILERCCSCEQRAVHVPMWLSLMKVAAGVAVVGALGAAGLVFGPLSSTDKYAVTVPRSVPGDSSFAVRPHGPGRGDLRVGRAPVPFIGPSVMNASHVAKTAAGNGGIEMIDDAILRKLLQAEELPAVLPNSVRHVWVVDDAHSSLQALVQAIPAGLAPLCVKREGTTACFHIPLTDTDLQTVVDSLEAAGWALVTPDLPQPGGMDLFLATGKEILYVVDVVSR